MKRDIFIGDIHGCFHELQELLAQLAVTPEDRVISVGDLVDRGPDSVRLWDFFCTRPNSLVLMGNHERKHVRGVLSFSQEIVKLQFGPRYEAFRAWASKLPYFLETPEVLVVHGGFENKVLPNSQREDVLSATTSGTRYLERIYDGGDWAELYDGPKPIVFGHRVVGDSAKLYGKHAYGIDTGACHGGYLSALVVPGFEIHRVKAQRDYWKTELATWQEPVLRARPWASFKFTKIERELAELDQNRALEVQAFSTELRHWLKALEDLLPSLIERAHTRVRALQPEADEPETDERAFRKTIGKQPQAGLLFSAHAGSLNLESIKTQLSTRQAIVKAVQDFELTEPAAPEGPKLPRAVD